MIRPSFDLGLSRWARLLSATQWALRGVLVAAAALGLVAADQAAADGIAAFWVISVALCTTWTFFSVDSPAAAVTAAALCVTWWTQVDDPVSGWMLVFALSLLAVHASAALAAVGPPGASIGADTLRRWGLASALVALAVSIAWVICVAADDVSMRASTTRLVAALVAVALLILGIRFSSLGESGPADDLGRRAERP